MPPRSSAASLHAARDDPINAQAEAAGLRTLFLPGLHDDAPGTRLSDPTARLTVNRIAWASEVLNCRA